MAVFGHSSGELTARKIIGNGIGLRLPDRIKRHAVRLHGKFRAVGIFHLGAAQNGGPPHKRAIFARHGIKRKGYHSIGIGSHRVHRARTAIGVKIHSVGQCMPLCIEYTLARTSAFNGVASNLHFGIGEPTEKFIALTRRRFQGNRSVAFAINGRILKMVNTVVAQLIANGIFHLFPNGIEHLVTHGRHFEEALGIIYRLTVGSCCPACQHMSVVYKGTCGKLCLAAQCDLYGIHHTAGIRMVCIKIHVIFHRCPNGIKRERTHIFMRIFSVHLILNGHVFYLIISRPTDQLIAFTRKTGIGQIDRCFKPNLHGNCFSVFIIGMETDGIITRLPKSIQHDISLTVRNSIITALWIHQRSVGRFRISCKGIALAGKISLVQEKHVPNIHIVICLNITHTAVGIQVDISRHCFPNGIKHCAISRSKGIVGSRAVFRAARTAGGRPTDKVVAITCKGSSRQFHT